MNEALTVKSNLSPSGSANASMALTRSMTEYDLRKKSMKSKSRVKFMIDQTNASISI